MKRPPHIATLIAELEEYAKTEALGIISPDALRRRLKEAAKALADLTQPNAFIPLDMPAFRVARAEDYFTWHPETWGKPVQFLAIRDLARPWAIATPKGINDGSLGALMSNVIQFPAARQAPQEAPQAPEAISAPVVRACPKDATPGQKKPSRWPLPCGRNSRWKKPLHGHAIPRSKRTKDNDA
jgi:hypothetical protein